MSTQEIVEGVEEVIDTVERIPNVNLNGTTKKQQIIILGVTAAVSAASAGGLVYFLSKRTFKAKYERIAEAEIAEAKRFYGVLHKKDNKFSDPVEALKQRTEDLGYAAKHSPEPAKDEEVPEVAEPTTRLIKEAQVRAVSVDETRNVFEDAMPSDDTFNYEEEIRLRTETEPYIISYDEYFQGEKDYQQTTLTYFAGDDVLTDDRDQPIDESDKAVGDENLRRFGHGSKDNNIVYIRNDRLEIDFEVCRSQGKYTEEILGFIKHTDRPGSGKVRKFRDDDE